MINCMRTGSNPSRLVSLDKGIQYHAYSQCDIIQNFEWTKKYCLLSILGSNQDFCFENLVRLSLQKYPNIINIKRNCVRIYVQGVSNVIWIYGYESELCTYICVRGIECHLILRLWEWAVYVYMCEGYRMSSVVFFK
jgi:hypothetical protein